MQAHTILTMVNFLIFLLSIINQLIGCGDLYQLSQICYNIHSIARFAHNFVSHKNRYLMPETSKIECIKKNINYCCLKYMDLYIVDL
jgi:hypothetical protein